jgi:hypothetical protein
MKLHVYIGFDAIDHLAYRVCEASILAHTTRDIEIHPIRDWQVRGEGFYYRSWQMQPSGQKMDIQDKRPHSTEFSYTRFLTPVIHRTKEREGPALFMDADMMLRDDIAKLFELADKDYDVMCVKHDYTPPEEEKIVGVVQQQYDRKNWSSVMLFPDPESCQLEIANVNTKDRDWLHQMMWANQIGELPERWNWLEGWSQHIDPAIVHFTRGTPDLPDWGDVQYAFEYWENAWAAGWKGHNEL